jgi:putative copper export protein
VSSPRLRKQASARCAFLRTSGAPAATIRRTLALELGVLLAVLVLAATLSQTAPPR